MSKFDIVHYLGAIDLLLGCLTWIPRYSKLFVHILAFYELLLRWQLSYDINQLIKELGFLKLRKIGNKNGKCLLFSDGLF